MAGHFKLDRSFPPSDTSRLFDVDARRATVNEIEDTLDELAQAYRDVACIKRKMDGLRTTLAHRKTQPNTYTNVSAMTPEILREIFLKCLCNHRSQLDDLPLTSDACTMKQGAGHFPEQAAVHVLKRLSSVCSSCNSIVSSSPELWVTIDFGAGEFHISEALVRAKAIDMYSESRFSVIYQLDDACMRIGRILEGLHRIEELHIYNWWGKLDSEKSLMKYASHQAPMHWSICRTLDVR